MLNGNYALALRVIRRSKWQSFFTMFGIIAGIVSVVTIVSLGQGIKQQIVKQVNQLGNDLVTVRPGNVVTRDKDGDIVSVNPNYAYGFGSGSLNESDVEAVVGAKHVGQFSAASLLNSGASSGDVTYDNGFILGTDINFPDIINQKVEFGSYFTKGEESRQVAVIGKRVAEQLFKENVPIGQSLTIRGQEFIVRGVFEEFNSGLFGQGIDLNTGIYTPRTRLAEVAPESTQIVRVLVRPDEPKNTTKLVNDLNIKITKLHGGQKDFAVIRQEENIQVTGDILTKLTTLIAGIAGISLLVGGIGIMNIMLVSVSERTHEIGIRKAIGATNRQIRNQFMAEATMLGLIGGFWGIVLSYVANYFIRITTELKPVITIEIIVIASVVAIVEGIIFGTIPAIKAARKNPIDSLRISN